MSVARALGMIETRGLIGSIMAADAMVKSADVSLIKQEKVDAALVTVLVEGDVSAVQAAVEAGMDAASRVGGLISAHVIPHPDEGIKQILLKDPKKGGGQRSKRIKENAKNILPSIKDKNESINNGKSKRKNSEESSKLHEDNKNEPSNEDDK
jgi:ethanolamine utilization protein EutM